MTLEEQACNFETMRHIERVRNLLNKIVKHLLDRGEKHDQCKLASPEVELFTEYTPKLAECEYNSVEYKEYLTKLKPALDHHYANSRHHPEHFKNGMDDMHLVDLVELFVDWKAASERQHNGNLKTSIEKNGTRFNMSPQLVKIFENSVDLFE